VEAAHSRYGYTANRKLVGIFRNVSRMPAHGRMILVMELLYTFVDHLKCHSSAITIKGTAGSIMRWHFGNIKELREAFGDAVASVVQISS